MHNRRPYLLFAAATLNALITLTILSAQPEESPVSISAEGSAPSKPEYTKEAEAKSNINEVNDFDFFIGSWRVHHRRLKKRLAHNDDWEEFEGTAVAQKILGGLGTMDEKVIERPGGAYRTVTFQTYDASKRLWSILWIDSRTPTDLDKPLIGRFENGIGTFYADDVSQGKPVRPIRVRHLWTNLSTTPHWEQAFSEDGGKTWETNWTMDFTRTQ